MTIPNPAPYCCGGLHSADPPTTFVVFKGRVYRPPFVCLCCGKLICARQFAFGRACGYCDTGKCEKSLGHWERGHGRYKEFMSAEDATGLEAVEGGVG